MAIEIEQSVELKITRKKDTRGWWRHLQNWVIIINVCMIQAKQGKEKWIKFKCILTLMSYVASTHAHTYMSELNCQKNLVATLVVPKSNIILIKFWPYSTDHPDSFCWFIGLNSWKKIQWWWKEKNSFLNRIFQIQGIISYIFSSIFDWFHPFFCY